MSVIKRAKFTTFTPGNCSVPEGCSITFDPQSQFQYFPSNSSNYFMTVEGQVSCVYEDNSVYLANNLYTNSWSSYIEPWDYSKSVNVIIDNGTFLQVTTENVSTSQCTFKAAKITNETISHTGNKKTFLYVRGENFLVDGEEKRSLNTQNTLVTTFPSGNTVSFTVTANSTPVTVIAIEID